MRSYRTRYCFVARRVIPQVGDRTPVMCPPHNAGPDLPLAVRARRDNKRKIDLQQVGDLGQLAADRAAQRGERRNDDERDDSQHDGVLSHRLAGLLAGLEQKALEVLNHWLVHLLRWLVGDDSCSCLSGRDTSLRELTSASPSK